MAIFGQSAPAPDTTAAALQQTPTASPQDNAIPTATSPTTSGSTAFPIAQPSVTSPEAKKTPAASPQDNAIPTAPSPATVGSTAFPTAQPSVISPDANQLDRIDVKVLEPVLQLALANYVDAKAKETQNSGFWAKAAAQPAAWAVLSAVMASLLGFLANYYITNLTLKKQEAREVQLQKDRNQHELNRDDLIAISQTKREMELAKQEGEQVKALETMRAHLGIEDKVRQLRYERLEKFYAPLYALFQQSRGVADKLFHHTYSKRNDSCWNGRELAFMTVEEATDNKPPSESELKDTKAPRRRVYIKQNGEWIVLRMLDFMPIFLQDQHSKVLVDQIIQIGRKCVEVISQNSGLAATGYEFSTRLGEYLAHFAILEGIYKDPPAEPFEPGSQRVGYYPMGLDNEVEKGYENARKEVLAYESFSSLKP